MSSDNSASSDRSRVTVHLKVLMEPVRFSLTEMVNAMKQVYSASGIQLEIGSTERISRPDLMDVDVGECVFGQTTDEQRELFKIRGKASSSEVVAYCCRSTNPPFNGCAAHPTGIPACVISAHASKWSLGHEIGHVLSLRHVSDSDRLMFGGGTDNVTNPPPDFVTSEVTQMRNSGLIK